MRRIPLYRKFHHNELTFRSVYAFSENFVLPLSHDEVVYGKGSLIGKMPGDDWHKFANLRTLFGYMYAQPGKKLLFMGGEFAQWSEWNHENCLTWSLLEQSAHASIRLLVGDLNRLYRSEPALYTDEYLPTSFEWIDNSDAENNVLAFLRYGSSSHEHIAVLCNFSAVPRDSYRIGAPQKGRWEEILNTDAKDYGGTGRGNFGAIQTVPFGLHGHPYSMTVNLPPLAVVFLKYAGD